MQFLEKALDSTGTRKVLICSLLSCFQVCEDKWVPGAVFCSQERAESILAEQEEVCFKKNVPFWCIWTRFSIMIHVCTEWNQPSSPGLVAWCGLSPLGNLVVILKALILQFSLWWGSQENHLESWLQGVGLSSSFYSAFFFAWGHLDPWSHWSQWSLCVLLSCLLPLRSNHIIKQL